MNEKSDALHASQQARIWALVIPREHGAWGLLLVPLFTGVVAGFASEHRIWPLLMFTVAALSLFWLRTPVESLIGTSSLTANTESERRTALIAAILLAALATTCLTGLMWKGQNLQLLLLGGATAFALVVQTGLRRLGRRARMAAQLVGAIALTCTAPAAYYIGTGRLSERAFILWVANWVFACDQIHFVQLRIHSARAHTFSEKFAQREIVLTGAASIACLPGRGIVLARFPPLVIVAFVPATRSRDAVVFRKPEPLDVRSLGWSEMK